MPGMMPGPKVRLGDIDSHPSCPADLVGWLHGAMTSSAARRRVHLKHYLALAGWLVAFALAAYALSTNVRNPNSDGSDILVGRYNCICATSFGGISEEDMAAHNEIITLNRARFHALLAAGRVSTASEYKTHRVHWMLRSPDRSETFFVDVNGVVRSGNVYRKLDVEALAELSAAGGL